jgi:hypothetical protein
VALLALVAGQDVEPGDAPGQWRIAQRTADDRVISVHDPDARHVHKTSHAYRDGYKAHVAAEPEPETGLVTDCELTAGNIGDAAAAPGLIDDEPAGTEILGDCAYGSGEFRDTSATVGCTPRSSRRHYGPPSRAGSHSTTSPSTTAPGP